MTEEKPTARGKTARIGRITGLFLAALGILAVVAWLVRQPIAEMIARSVCEGQRLSCQLSITRLDFGGVTLTGVEARAPGGTESALSAGEVDVTLAWDGPFSPRASAVSGKAVVVRVDLTGRRPLLGDLDQAVTTFTQPSDAPQALAPKLDFADITIIGETLSGQLIAKGKVTAGDANAIVIEATAPAASLGLDGATVSLSGAELNAVVAGEKISAALKLDMSRFEASGTSFSDVKIDVTVEQDAGVLRGEGSASLGALETNGAQLSGAQAKGSIEAAAIDTAAFRLGQWLSKVRKFELAASTGEGDAVGVAWKRSQLSALIEPLATGGSGGDISFSAEDLRTPQAAAGSFEVDGKIVMGGESGSASGKMHARAVSLTTQQRHVIAQNVSGPLAAVLPEFADAASRAIDRAAQGFELTAPWTASASATDTLELALSDEVVLKATSGLTARLTPRAGASQILVLTTADEGSWRGSGDLHLAGGGGPTLRLGVDRAEGSAKAVALEGALVLSPWKIGADSVAAELSGLKFQAAGASGSAAGGMKVMLGGAIAGGVWKDMRATGQVSASWDGDTFTANAPAGATIGWTEAVYGDTRFGAAEISYRPTGVFARGKAGSVTGQGSLGEVVIPVSAEGFTASARLGATGINWRAANGVRATFDMQPSSVDLKLETEAIAIAINDIKGNLALDRGWKVSGEATGGAVTSSTVLLSDLKGKFDLAGEGDKLSGSLSEVTTHIADALTGAGKRFEEANFAGGAQLAAGVVDFNGQVNLAESGVQIAQISGRHSLEDNTGSLTFDRTPLIFSRRTFQPFHLSPLLVGPAGVTGRVDIAGSASWGNDALKASATLDLRNVGFVLASAGAFEGVSGKIEVSDLLNMKSAPGQKLTIDKVTLGMPLENGVIDFQLIGFEAIRIAGAEWPFVGGFIRVKPTDFTFASTARNVIVAQAVDWNLDTLVKQFEIPDLKLQGKVGGDFPVVFSAGSAEIDNAVLASSGPGVIQYGGAATDAAAQNEPTTAIVMDALKNFRFEVLKIGLDGNLAGKMILTLDMLGRNPAVMNGQAFQLNISIDSELAKLVNSLTLGTDIQGAIRETRENGQGERQ